MFEREYRELSFVPRWSIIRTIRQQSVAEHSYYVTLYAGQVADLIEWKGNRTQLLDYALRHDIEEGYISDIPGPSKRKIVDTEKYIHTTEMGNITLYGEDYKNHSGMFNYTVDMIDIKAIVKVADLLDECFFLATEIQLGNKSLGRVMANSRQRLFDAFGKLPLNPQDMFILKWDKIIAALDDHQINDSRVPTVP